MNKILNRFTKTKACLLGTLFGAFSTCASAVNFVDPNTFDHIEDYEDAYVFDDNAVGGSNGGLFDDKDDIESRHPWIKPTRVVVRHGSRVDKISVTYGYTEGTDEFTVSHGGSGGGVGTIYLADDKFIEKIKICSTDSNTTKGRVGQIQITVTGNHTYTYGDTCKGSRTYTAPSGWHIIGFKGRRGNEVDRLQPLYALKLKVATHILIGTPIESNPQILDSTRSVIMNDNSTPTSSQLFYEQTTGEVRTTTWSNTSTFSLGYTLSVATSLEMIGPASGSISTTQTYSTEFTNSFMYGATSTENTSTKNRVTHNYSAGAKKVVAASVTNSKTDAVAPLEIKYTNIFTGTVHRSTGTVDSYAISQSAVSVLEIGYFDSSNIMRVYTAYASHPTYGCYDGKYAWQAETTCAL